MNGGPIRGHAWQPFGWLLAFVLGAAPAAAAEGTEGLSYTVSGFGTLGAVHSSEDQADYTASFLQPNGAGHTRDWAFGVDSRLGLQLRVDWGERWSAVLQVISEHRYDNSFDPLVEWANLRYALTEDFALRAGRIAVPALLISDYRKVSYANVWIRPPVEVYGLLPVTNSDGVDATYRLRMDSVTNSTQALYGRSNIRTPTGRAKARDVWGISNTTEAGPATLRLGFLRGNATFGAADPLLDAFRQFGPQGDAIADRYELKSKPTTLIAVGASYDPGEWYLMAEWARSRTKSHVGTHRGWYVSGGYRWGAFTGFVGYADSKQTSRTSDPGLSPVGLPPPVGAAVAGLNAGLNVLLQPNDRSTIFVGGRWDVARNVAVKAQWDHIRLGADSTGSLVNVQSEFESGGKLNVFSIAVDFVF